MEAPSDKFKRVLIKLGYSPIEVAKYNKREAQQAFMEGTRDPRTPFAHWLRKKQADEAMIDKPLVKSVRQALVRCTSQRELMSLGENIANQEGLNEPTLKRLRQLWLKKSKQIN